jgi:membrane fusion protein (multidrug efflux system)
MMRRVWVTLVAITAIGLLAWLLWRGRGGEGEQTAVETEVAVHVGKIERRTLHAWVTAYGVVEPRPPGASSPAGARVSPAAPGVVLAVRCAEGERVQKGQLLFELDPRAADVAVEKAQRAADYARTTAERQRKLIGVEGTSRRQLLEAEQALAAAQADLDAARTQRAFLQVRSPVAGTVARIAVQPGDGVDLTTTLAVLADLDRLVVGAGVPSAELPPLRVGQAAEVRAEGLTAPLAGSVVSIRPEIDPRTGTALVRVEVPAHSGLRPGQLVTLRIASAEHKDRLAVPVESVVKNAEGATVIALVNGDRAVQKPVEVGLRDGGRVEVSAAGLKEGLSVVTEGAYALPAETRIRVLAQ